MKRKIPILFFILFLSTGSFIYSQPAIQWQKCLGGSNTDRAFSVQKAYGGGYIAVGFSTYNGGDVTGNHGSQDCWIVKLDTGGLLQWQKSFGGSGGDVANSSAKTDDRGYIFAGTTSSNNGDVTGNHGSQDYWIVKLDSNGVLQWQKCMGGTGLEEANSIAQTNDRGYIVAGRTYSNDGDVTFNHGATDYWVVKLDSSGTIQWQKSLGGSGDDNAKSIVQTRDGGYIVAGVTTSNDGDVTGFHGPAGYSDSWIVKLDSTGIIQWQKCLGGSNIDDANSILETNDGGFMVAGSAGSLDGDVSTTHIQGFGECWIVKLNVNGIIQWQKCFGGSRQEVARSIQQTLNGGYIIAGQTNSNNGDVSGMHGDNDYWVMAFDSIGTFLWQKCLGGSGYDAATSILEDGVGFVVAGYAGSQDSDVTGNHGNEDFWVVKLSPVHGEDFTTTASTVPANLTFSQAPYLITGKVLNLGYDTVTSFTMNYQVNGGSVVSGNISSVNIGPLSTYMFSHPVSWTPLSTGTYTIDIWASGINGNNDQDTSNDHFIFTVNVLDTFAIRNTCIEAFTGTWCLPCVIGDLNLDNDLIPPGNPHFVIIKYHWLDAYATTESSNRVAYYNINSIPRSEVDGQCDTNTQDLTRSALNSYQSIPSFMTIDISSATYSDTTVFVSGIITPLVNYDTGAYYLQVVVTEKRDSLQPGFNGETFFLNVMMKMSPDDTGTYIPAFFANTQIPFSQVIPMPCCNVENMDNLKVVVFVQNNNDKKIQQSAWHDVAPVITTSTKHIENSAEGISIYPNPADKNMVVKIMLERDAKVSTVITNMMGQVVSETERGTLHSGISDIAIKTSGLANGIYHFTLRAGEKTFTQNFIVGH